MAHLRGAVLRQRQRPGGQPQAARFVRQPGQPERVVLLHLHAPDHEQGFQQLHLRRQHKGQVLLAGRPRSLRPDLGNRPAVGPGSGSHHAEQPAQLHRRRLHPRHEGHADRRNGAARRIRGRFAQHELRRTAHEGL